PHSPNSSARPGLSCLQPGGERAERSHPGARSTAGRGRQRSGSIQEGGRQSRPGADEERAGDGGKRRESGDPGGGSGVTSRSTLPSGEESSRRRRRTGRRSAPPFANEPRQLGSGLLTAASGRASNEPRTGPASIESRHRGFVQPRRERPG